MRVTFAPGHLSRGGELLFALKVPHDSCRVCLEPFEGVRNQEVCGPCRSTDAGKEYIAERKRRVQRRLKARKSLCS